MSTIHSWLILVRCSSIDSHVLILMILMLLLLFLKEMLLEFIISINMTSTIRCLIHRVVIGTFKLPNVPSTPSRSCFAAVIQIYTSHFLVMLIFLGGVFAWSVPLGLIMRVVGWLEIFLMFRKILVWCQVFLSMLRSLLLLMSQLLITKRCRRTIILGLYLLLIKSWHH